ncbi:uncharacterized protein LOC120122144 [Hibiscus syriacus]|uniref:uncharacterized protein LOC120122144 n=1 Tax=Hibiscus syriacus TaxID=106335 RepID=UPI0019219680|nr:uncharacterized protein LOC120122144 [Hibiscus syriacus]
MLNLAATKGLFAYHPKCKKIGLTHLSFADDLLIFCKGNVDSVAGVLSVLYQFYQISGLKLNSSKCDIFYYGISYSVLQDLKIILGFKMGCLPVRYLGIPLVTYKLSLKDCEPLLDKIRQILHHWSARNLSYAGKTGQNRLCGICALPDHPKNGFPLIQDDTAAQVNAVRNFLRPPQ